MLPITASNPFKWRHYPGDIIMWCVRWYLRYPISFTHMAEMAVERGMAIDASCIWRWVQIYSPELDKRWRFFRRALQNEGNSAPGVINVDKNPAYPLAVKELKREGAISLRCWLRQCKYLNNVVEQDHRHVKRRTWLAKGYGSLWTA